MILNSHKGWLFHQPVPWVKTFFELGFWGRQERPRGHKGDGCRREGMSPISIPSPAANPADISPVSSVPGIVQGPPTDACAKESSLFEPGVL